MSLEDEGARYPGGRHKRHVALDRLECCPNSGDESGDPCLGTESEVYAQRVGHRADTSGRSAVGGRGDGGGESASGNEAADGRDHATDQQPATTRPCSASRPARHDGTVTGSSPVDPDRHRESHRWYPPCRSDRPCVQQRESCAHALAQRPDGRWRRSATLRGGGVRSFTRRSTAIRRSSFDEGLTAPIWHSSRLSTNASPIATTRSCCAAVTASSPIRCRRFICR